MIQKANNIILKINNLRTYFYTRKGIVRAVDDVSFDLKEGEILCIVGESGSGKTVTALSILRLVDKPGRIIDGEIIFQGRNLLRIPEGEMRSIRGRRIAIIFQDPQSSLNPVLTVGDQITEAIKLHLKFNEGKSRERAIDLLKRVGIPLPEERIKEHPHQFSGGMRQRVMIAIALSCDPDILIADEPTTALDVTIQAQLLEIFKELRDKRKMSMIYITHDLGVVRELADRIIVMYAGKFVEKGTARDIFKEPKHPYTLGLLGCLPKDEKRLASIPGTIPSLVDPPKGCVFHPRCSYSNRTCSQENPNWVRVSDTHWVACPRQGKSEKRVSHGQTS